MKKINWTDVIAAAIVVIIAAAAMSLLVFIAKLITISAPNWR